MLFITSPDCKHSNGQTCYRQNRTKILYQHWIYRVFQKDLNIFYSGHRGHRTWHPVIFSYGDTLKTMPTIHHSPKMCVNCKIAFELRCKPLMGTCWSASGRRDYRIDICRVTKGAHTEHLRADFGKLGRLHYLCVKLYPILTINT